MLVNIKQSLPIPGTFVFTCDKVSNNLITIMGKQHFYTEDFFVVAHWTYDHVEIFNKLKVRTLEYHRYPVVSTMNFAKFNEQKAMIEKMKFLISEVLATVKNVSVFASFSKEAKTHITQYLTTVNNRLKVLSTYNYSEEISAL